MTDVKEMTEDELEELRRLIVLEQERRSNIRTALSDMDSLSRQLLTSAGTEPGDPWVKPTGVTSAYPRGWEATHVGERWVSDLCGNMFEPGVEGWSIASSDPTPDQPVQ